MERGLYRITQEALTNVARHAQATEVAVLVRLEDHHLTMTIRDNGRGFSTLNKDSDGRKHLGLQSMRERASIMGAQLKVESAAGTRHLHHGQRDHPCQPRGPGTRYRFRRFPEVGQLMANGPKIRVLIADDHAILRAGLRMLIDSQPDMKVIAEAPNGEEAVRLAGAEHPDVVILDITMPGGGGLRAVPEILKVCASTRVLLLTMHEEPAYLRTALASGAAGYVLKKSVDANLLAAIRSVHKGRSYVDSELASALIQHAASGSRSTRTSG